MEDKLIVVYEGTIAQFRGDWLKDEYVNKLVIVTGNQSSISAGARKSYLCVASGEKSVAIPIPSVYLQGVIVDGAQYGYTDGYIRFAEANGVSISFDYKTGDLSIGISEELENTLSTLNTTITQVSKKADNAVSSAGLAVEKANSANQMASSAIATANEASAQVSGVTGIVAENKAKIKAIEEDYISKGEAVDFATDLTGVIETTPEEFVYRPSAGDKSIRDESAVIRRIKGNSVVWNQCAGYTAKSSYNGVTITHGADGVVQLTGALTSGDTVQSATVNNVYEHIYLVVVDVLSMGNTTFLKAGNLNLYTADFTQPSTVLKITKSTRQSNISFLGVWGLKESPNGVRLRLQQFDLTLMFGAGNEPATVEEFRAVYNDAYYPYCEPELRGMKTVAIQTVGFNLFDGSCARVIGGMSYVVSNYASAFYSETKNGTQTAAPIKDGVYTPECSGYLYLTPFKDSEAIPCVHFQHSGVSDGKCAPYVEHTLNLPEILSLFPKGMHAVGDVYDEINIDSYIQRCEYRNYVEGDESNAEVLTDGVHTVAKLAEPIVKQLNEPIKLDYYCEDWGSEEAISAGPSAPFRADIVYQFNAEGRIRDNSRNIDKLESIVAPLKNIPSRASLATQDFVLAHIPTQVATATERRKMFEGETMVTALLPNIVYDWTGGNSLQSSIKIPPLYINPETIGSYDHEWIVRVSSDTSDKVIIPFDVLWKDGIAPSWSSWCICDITFKSTAHSSDDVVRKTFGEWKIYK